MIELTQGHLSVRNPPIGLTDKDRVLFAHDLEQEIPPAHALTLHDVDLLEDLVWRLGRTIRLHGLMHERLGDWRTWARMGQRWLTKAPILFRSAKYIERGLWVTDDWSGNYFHWLTDVLPRLFASRKRFPDHTILLPEVFSTVGYMTASLDRMGEKNVHYIAPKERLRIAELVIPEQIAVSGNYNDPLLRQVRDAFLIHSVGVPAERNVFISRSKALTRRVMNDKAVNTIMVRNGFEVLSMEELSFDQQVSLMQETRNLVGTHGAGLTNMLFMPPGGNVLELRLAGDAHNNCYFSLASALGLNYHYQLNPGNHALTQLADVTVDPEVLQEKLRTMNAT